MTAQPTWDKLLEGGLSEVIVALSLAAGALVLLTAAAIIAVLLYRWHARPHKLPRQLDKELTAIRKRLTRLERNGSDAEATHALEERVSFVESLLTGTPDAAPLPGRSKEDAATEAAHSHKPTTKGSARCEYD